MDQSLLVEPELLDGLNWVSYAIGLYQNLTDRCVSNDVLYSCCQIGPAYSHVILGTTANTAIREFEEVAEGCS